MNSSVHIDGIPAGMFRMSNVRGIPEGMSTRSNVHGIPGVMVRRSTVRGVPEGMFAMCNGHGVPRGWWPQGVMAMVCPHGWSDANIAGIPVGMVRERTDRELVLYLRRSLYFQLFRSETAIKAGCLASDATIVQEW